MIQYSTLTKDKVDHFRLFEDTIIHSWIGRYSEAWWLNWLE